MMLSLQLLFVSRLWVEAQVSEPPSSYYDIQAHNPHE